MTTVALSLDKSQFYLPAKTPCGPREVLFAALGRPLAVPALPVCTTAQKNECLSDHSPGGSAPCRPERGCGAGLPPGFGGRNVTLGGRQPPTVSASYSTAER